MSPIVEQPGSLPEASWKKTSGGGCLVITAGFLDMILLAKSSSKYLLPLRSVYSVESGSSERNGSSETTMNDCAEGPMQVNSSSLMTIFSIGYKDDEFASRILTWGVLTGMVCARTSSRGARS